MSLPEVIVEIGFTGTGTGTALHLDDTVRGLLDTGTLGADDLWTDVSAYVAGLTCRVGATRVDGPVLRPEAGVATIRLRNEDRRFDPTNLDGPYVASGATQVEPMRPVRIRAVWDGLGYQLWRGFAEQWRVTYPGPNVSEVILTCVDAFKVFEAWDRAAEPAAGAGEDTGARIGRILDSVGWPALDRVIATGDTLLQETTLEGPALAELLTAVESEAGECYMDGDGRLFFRNRNAVLTDTRSNTSQATFGDEDPELRYHGDIDITYDDQIVNLARVTREGGTEQTVEDAASRTRYLTRTWVRTGLAMASDDDAASMAGWVVHQARTPELRPEQMTLNPRRDPTALYPQALGRLIGDRITVRRRPPGGGDPIERDVFIRGIAHEYGPKRWRTTWQMQSASKYSFLTLDNPTLGTLDTNALAY